MSTDLYYTVNKTEMEDFMDRCMVTAGSKPTHAKMLASLLVEADYRGHFSHGLNRLGIINISIKSNFIIVYVPNFGQKN